MREQEEWRPLRIHNGYEISSHGRVRRTFKARGPYHLPCEVTGWVPTIGYRAVGIRVDGKRRTFWVHRLVAETFIGPQPSRKHVVAHADGDRLNNHLSNLRWATYKENESDKIRHGTDQRGERGSRSKLTMKEAMEIRKLYADGISGMLLAECYGIDPSNLYRVLRHETYIA